MKRQLTIVAILSVLVTSCASTSALRSRNDEKRRVQDEANEFYSAWQDKNIEKIWKLSSPSFQSHNQPKEVWIRHADSILRSLTFLDYSNLTVVYLDKKLAITQADVLFTQEGENFKVCERIIWLKFPEGWRFEEIGSTCDYMPDKKRIEFLTKNVPDQ